MNGENQETIQLSVSCAPYNDVVSLSREFNLNSLAASPLNPKTLDPNPNT